MIGWVRRALRRRGEDGVGLILVIGVSVFVFLLAAAAVGLAINGLTQSRNRTNFEKSLANAEAGIDSTLGKLQTSFSVYGADYPVPAPTTELDVTPQCQAPLIEYPPTGDGAGGVFSSEATEKAWASANLLFIAASYPGCIRTGDDGQYVILKPPSAQPKYGRVYALAAMPSFDDPQRTRIVKDEYIFMPYRPTSAILAGGNLTISSSTSVFVADGTPAHTAGVHANGSLTGTGNPTIDGPVTFSGDSGSLGTNKIYGGTVTKSPTESIPFISARQIYSQAQAKAAGDPASVANWYDLCSNGTVTHFATTGDPCSGTSAGDSVASGGTFRGWGFSIVSGAPTWSASSAVLDGSYYVDQGNVVTGPGNGDLGKVTVIAGSKDPASCDTKKYGNISWDHYGIGQVSYGGLWFVADADLVTTSNFSAGSKTAPVSSGVFAAGDQMNMETSSQGAVGSVIIGNQCATSDGPVASSEVKNPTVYYDANADGAFTSVVTTSLWLDYNGA